MAIPRREQTEADFTKAVELGYWPDPELDCRIHRDTASSRDLHIPWGKLGEKIAGGGLAMFGVALLLFPLGLAGVTIAQTVMVVILVTLLVAICAAFVGALAWCAYTIWKGE